MQYYRQSLAILAIAGFCVFLIVLILSEVVTLNEVSVAIVAAIVGAIFLIAWWGFRKSIEDEDKPKKVEVINLPQDTPILTLNPLTHFKGHMLPPKIKRLPDTKDGKHHAELTNVGDSTKEYNLLESSQRLEVITDILNSNPKELIAKFGVIRVRCVSGDAINVRAQIKVRIIQMYGQIHPTNFVDWGYLNWFDIVTKRKIQHNIDEIYPLKHLGLNKYLLNTHIDLHEGDEKDLLLFYMIKDLPSVYICSDVETAQVGSVFSSGQTLKFQVEIGVTAQKYPKNVWTYFVTINEFDDFKIERG